MDDATDLELFRKWKRGEQLAAGVLVDRHAADLWTWCTRRWGRLGEEVAQETWVHVIKMRDGSGSAFAGRGSFRGWLRTIARSIATRAAAAAERRAIELEGLPSLAASVESPTYFIRLEQLRRAITLLNPEEQREVATRYWLHGASMPDIAVGLGIPLATVKTRLHRARGKLSQALSELGEASP